MDTQCKARPLTEMLSDDSKYLYFVFATPLAQELKGWTVFFSKQKVIHTPCTGIYIYTSRAFIAGKNFQASPNVLQNFTADNVYGIHANTKDSSGDIVEHVEDEYLELFL